MAKKSMIAKANREPKFSTRAYTRCTRCGRPRSVYRKFGLCRVSFNDPIADMRTRVRNANSAGKATVSMPSSKKLVEIARIMTEEGYVQGYEIIENSPRDILEITMKYGEKKAKTIRGIKRISKPGLRIYAGKDELPRVLGGLGTAIVSTSKGVMADRDARMAGVGGEVIAYIW